MENLRKNFKRAGVSVRWFVEDTVAMNRQSMQEFADAVTPRKLVRKIKHAFRGNWETMKSVFGKKEDF